MALLVWLGVESVASLDVGIAVLDLLALRSLSTLDVSLRLRIRSVSVGGKSLGESVMADGASTPGSRDVISETAGSGAGVSVLGPSTLYC